MITISEELQVLREAETPGSGIGPGINPLSELVYQSAIGKSIDILSTAKEIDAVVEPAASIYLQKITGVASQVARKNVTTLDTLRKLMVSIIGNSAVTFTQVSNADESAWIGFIEAEALTMFEMMGGVLPHEKQAYDALP